VSFEEELARTLPEEVPHRDRLIALAAAHLRAIEEMNQVMNLTRILSAADAAIKHVYDSIWPWRHFQTAKRVLDAGTGAGFPGVPLAIVLPDVNFVLAESTQKKARFVESVVDAIGLENVSVAALRAEDLLRGGNFDIVTARAVAPLAKAIPLFAPAFQQRARVLLYKGPDVEAEIAEAWPEIQKRGLAVSVVDRYQLPEESGERTLIEVRTQPSTTVLQTPYTTERTAR
jgi:16S rRNA (guanine527-N7)-methyltransferase